MLDQLLDPSTPLFWIFISILAGVVSILLMRRFRYIVILIRFSYPNAKFNAMGNRFVHEDELDRLVESNDVSDALNMIASKDYEFKELRTLAEIDHALRATKFAFFDRMASELPTVVQPVLDAYMRKFEMGMVKAALRAKLFDQPKATLERALVPVGSLSHKTIEKLVDAERVEDVAAILEHEPYADLIKSHIEARERSAGKVGFDTLEHALDRFVIEELKEAVEDIDRMIQPAVREFVLEYIDIVNLKLLYRTTHLNYPSDRIYELLMSDGLRLSDWKLEQLSRAENVQELTAQLDGTPCHRPLKNAFLRYMKEKSAAVFELVLDQYLLRQSIRYSTKHFTTVGPMVRFMISKEFEMRNLRTVLHGLSERWTREQLRPLLVTESREV